MARTYAAYLLRHWRHADGRERVEVQEVATGARHCFASLADAWAWLAAAGPRPAGRDAAGSPGAAPARDPPGAPPD